MKISEKDRKHFSEVAEHSLEAFRTIADAAREWLNSGRQLDSSALASINTFTDESANEITSINRSQYDACEHLQREPVIARVVAIDESNKKHTYFVCAVAPQQASVGAARLVSYKADAGRLAALPMGDGIEVGSNRNYLEVVESAALSPQLFGDGWDAIDTVVRRAGFSSVTIDSLRKLVSGGLLDLQDTTEIDRIIAEAAASEAFKATRRRNIISKMSLRSQPLLDQFQDEIFRLPLDQRLAIIGPPGTGKTTTLIMRLGQKVQLAYLDEREREVIGRGSLGATDHSQSWLMFTPTDLLKQFVKEAFARHQIPASDQRIKTWDIHRNTLARNVFGFLRSGSGSGLVMRDQADTISPSAISDSTGWYAEFDDWQQQRFRNQLRDAASRLAENPAAAVTAIGTRLTALLDRASSTSTPKMLISLSELVGDLHSLINELKAESDSALRRAVTLQHNRDPKFLESLAVFIEGLGDIDEPADSGEEVDDPDTDEDEEEVAPSQMGAAGAITAYSRALRAHARARARGRRLSVGRTGKIVTWLGDRSLNDEEFIGLGKRLLVQADLRRFVSSTRTYLRRMADRYRQFRRHSRSTGDWYKGTSTDVHPLEVDIILLAILRGSRELLSEPRVLREIEGGAFGALQPVVSELRTQILIDEASDFSPVQIACMASLSHPQIDSVFLCGDYNQRLTVWGSRSASDLKWALRGLEFRPVTVAYRQSRQLLEFATELLALSSGDASRAELPPEVENDGYDPVLATDLADIPALSGWLGERITEIERHSGVRGLPSIAVLVNGEELVGPIAEGLNKALVEHNIRVAPCHEGRTIGDATEVRVFDVRHIKGLEFEAVFFVGVDRLAKVQPALFGQYLYVGATRAATYLGITCDGSDLPEPLTQLAKRCQARWRN